MGGGWGSGLAGGSAEQGCVCHSHKSHRPAHPHPLPPRGSGPQTVAAHLAIATCSQTTSVAEWLDVRCRPGFDSRVELFPGRVIIGTPVATT